VYSCCSAPKGSNPKKEEFREGARVMHHRRKGKGEHGGKRKRRGDLTSHRSLDLETKQTEQTQNLSLGKVRSAPRHIWISRRVGKGKEGSLGTGGISQSA